MNTLSFKLRTCWWVWLLCFVALTIASSNYEVYPDCRLWQAWLLLPVTGFMGLLNMDSEVATHVVLMLGVLALLVSVSCLLHIVLLAAWGAVKNRNWTAQPDAAPNGGPATPVGNSAVTEGPPSGS